MPHIKFHITFGLIGLLPKLVWNYNGHNIEVANDVYYFGTVFHYTGNSALIQKHIHVHEKVVKALTTLLFSCKKYLFLLEASSCLCWIYIELLIPNQGYLKDSVEVLINLMYTECYFKCM